MSDNMSCWLSWIFFLFFFIFIHQRFICLLSMYSHNYLSSHMDCLYYYHYPSYVLLPESFHVLRCSNHCNDDVRLRFKNKSRFGALKAETCISRYPWIPVGTCRYLLAADDPSCYRYLTCWGRSPVGTYPYGSGFGFLKWKYLRVGSGSTRELTRGVP